VIRRLLALGAAAAALLVQPAEAKGNIAVTTRNAGPLVAWYRATFGLSPVRTIHPEGENLTVTMLDGALATVEILSRPDAQQAGSAMRRIGIYKAGFMVDDLDPWIAKWRAANLMFAGGPFDDEMTGLRSVILADPDGNLIHVTAPLPKP